jgi:SAM-dependent methyltransferase
MADRNAAFVGSVPENYDRYLAPVFFDHYADDLAARLDVTHGMRVLEVACGTGIVTERLGRRLAGVGSLVATDFNEPMLAYAARKALGDGVEWRQADGTKLPFDDRSFEAVVCQFGLMFFPDKVAGLREALRVLKPGGRYLFNVWDTIERNPIARIAHETIASFFPSDPPQFYQVPFSLHDSAAILHWLRDVGFAAPRCHVVAKVGQSPRAADAAHGLVRGNPVYAAIMERRPEALQEIERAVAARVAAELGDHPVRCPLQALVFTAGRP